MYVEISFYLWNESGLVLETHRVARLAIHQLPRMSQGRSSFRNRGGLGARYRYLAIKPTAPHAGISGCTPTASESPNAETTASSQARPARFARCAIGRDW